MEGLLNDLECSVCLGSLDESNKVLPCQHTFCKRCLVDIVESKKELRCPECRILVETKIDDLPPNVILIRILERMKTLTVPEPKSLPASVGESPATAKPENSPVQKESLAKAIFDYESSEPGDLTFKTGDVIQLRRRIDKNWFLGESSGRSGVFPANHVQVVVPLPAALCKAMYDFQMKEDEREGCLTFTRGTTIHVLRRVDQNWAEGRINNSIGIFPISFVELNSMARQLLDFPRSPRGEKMRQPPAVPGVETPEGAKKATQTPVKRMPGTGSVRGVQNLPQPCIALYPYKPQKPDEIELKKGCVYYVLEKCQDGWFKGMSRSFISGVFPGNYVAMIKSKEHFSSEAFQQMVQQQSSDAQKAIPSNPPTLPERNANSKLTSLTATPTTGAGKENDKHSKDDSTIGLLKRFTKNALGSSAKGGPLSGRKSSSEAESGSQPVHTRSGSCPSQLLQTNPARLVKETGFLSNRPSKPTILEKSSSSTSQGGPLLNNGSSHTSYRHKKSYSLDSSAAATAARTASRAERYRCIVPYPPSSEYELELNVGDTIMVSKKRENGWYKGQHERTGKVGLFPASFVVRVNEQQQQS